ncbi:MAG TPA: hypothetical protein VD761_10555 [Solirubrobacterales bacterium]|nr:hypothetical protein [Solirubrobacterales bacterium]
MRERWEYKTISWASATDLPFLRTSDERVWRNEFSIRETGKGLERRLGYSNHREDDGAEMVKIQDLLNEFGAQGWELVSETVMDTTIVSDHAGWSKVGTPIEIRWILKRRVQS